MREIELATLASEIKAAQDSNRQVETFTARIPGFDLAAAYDVAHRVHRSRLLEGARAVGRKIGFTNPAMWAMYGVREPIWAYIYDRTVVPSSNDRASCRLGRFAEPRIEAEIVFGFRSAPRPGATLAELLDSIEWVASGFEVVQSHFPAWKFAAADTVADGGLHGALLLGPAQPLSRLGKNPVAALQSFTLTLSCNGRDVEAGRGSNVMGSPLAAIDHLTKVLARQPNDAFLTAGEIVTTGTVTMPHAVHAGETWRSRVQGLELPDLEVEFSE